MGSDDSGGADGGYASFLAFLGGGSARDNGDVEHGQRRQGQGARDDDKEFVAFLTWLGDSALDASGLAPLSALSVGDKYGDGPYNFFRGFGRLHPKLQRIDCEATGVHDLLRNVLPEGRNPVKAWCEDLDEIEEGDTRTWMPSDEEPAFYVPSSCDDHDRASDAVAYVVVTYSDIRRMISKVDTFSSRDVRVIANNTPVVVAVLLPSCLMTDTALAILAIMADANAIAAPLEPDMTPNEVHSALDQLGCRAMVTTKELWERIEPTLVEKGVRESISDVRFVEEFRDVKEGMRWTYHQEPSGAYDSVVEDYENEDEVCKKDASEIDMPKMLLRTSGTTSKPKVVPITGRAMLYNGVCFAAGLGLRRSDVKLNALPFYHIGGWNSLVAVLVAGSSCIVSTHTHDVILRIFLY